MENIKWQRGVFLKFFAKMKIRVGGSNSPVDIHKGDEFEYDGSILKYSGMEIPQPQMRGAIANGWAHLEESQDETVESVRPTRSIAKAQTINRDLNRVQRNTNVPVETTSLDEDEVLRVTDRSDKTKIITANDNRRSRGMSVNSDANDDQGAVKIGRVRTSAKQVFGDVSKPDTDRKIRELENMSNVRADLDNNTVTREGVTITTNVGSVNRIASEQESDGVEIGKVRHTKSGSVEGVSITDTSNIREERKPAKAKASVPANSGYTPDKSLNPRIRVARSIYPEFPSSWSFEGKLADRLAALKAVNPTPAFLDALYAAEGDQMRKVLAKEYPDQFA